MTNYIVKDENAIYYECGYSCDNAIYLRLGSEGFFFTDSRYEIEANETIKNTRVIIARELAKQAAELIDKHHIRNITFDPNEWYVADFGILTSNCKATFIESTKFSQQKRIIKNTNELELLRTAALYGAKAFDSFASFVSTDGFGNDEYYLTHMAKNILSSEGKYTLSFDPIVAINSNAAKPHAMPSSKKLTKNDLLLFDAGLKFERYCSDRTRTISCYGDIGVNYSQQFGMNERQKVYDLVLKAHDEAISKARAGMKASEIDTLARNVIEEGGYSKYFVHSTGHGVGLDIHELPVISSKSDTIIEDGMVFTIEPGIYLPNDFGVRIEDTVEIKNGKAVIL